MKFSLLKTENWKGYSPDFWHCVSRKKDKLANTTTFTFHLWKNRNKWNDGRDCRIPDVEKQVTLPGVKFTVAELKTGLVASQMKDVVTTAYVPPIFNPDGTVLVQGVAEATTNVEQNYFVGATIDNDPEPIIR